MVILGRGEWERGGVDFHIDEGARCSLSVDIRFAILLVRNRQTPNVTIAAGNWSESGIRQNMFTRTHDTPFPPSLPGSPHADPPAPGP